MIFQVCRNSDIDQPRDEKHAESHWSYHRSQYSSLPRQDQRTVCSLLQAQLVRHNTIHTSLPFKNDSKDPRCTLMYESATTVKNAMGQMLNRFKQDPQEYQCRSTGSNEKQKHVLTKNINSESQNARTVNGFMRSSKNNGSQSYGSHDERFRNNSLEKAAVQ